MIYLYIKKHQVTGLKYFGATTRNPFRYNGSGTRWIKHCRTHGFDIITIEVSGFDDDDLCRNYALKFSRDNNIVESREWANLIEEDGFCGGYVRSPELRRKLSEAKKGKNVGPDNHFFGKSHTVESRRRISKAKKGLGIGKENSFYGRTHTKEVRDKVSQSRKGHIKSEETRKLSSVALTGRSKGDNFRKALQSYSSSRKWIVSRNGEISHCLDDNDPRLLSGHWMFGKKWRGD